MRVIDPLSQQADQRLLNGVTRAEMETMSAKVPEVAAHPPWPMD